eukprot:1435197-Amphidinium_carterae.1
MQWWPAGSVRARVNTGFVFDKDHKHFQPISSSTQRRCGHAVHFAFLSIVALCQDVPSESAAIDSGSKATFAEHAEVLEAWQDDSFQKNLHCTSVSPNIARRRPKPGPK